MKIYKTTGTVTSIDYIEVINSTPEVVINDIQQLFSVFNLSRDEIMNIEEYKQYFVTKN